MTAVSDKGVRSSSSFIRTATAVDRQTRPAAVVPNQSRSKRTTRLYFFSRNYEEKLSEAAAHITNSNQRLYGPFV